MKRLWHRVFGHGDVPISLGEGFDRDMSRCKCGRLVKNGSRLVSIAETSGDILVMPRKLTEQEVAEIRAQWQERYSKNPPEITRLDE